MKVKVNRSGIASITLIVLFTAVLGLSLALFYIANSKVSLKETVFTVEGNQALACAESGVDIAIQCIKSEKLAGSSITNIQNKCKVKDKIAIDDSEPGSCEYTYSLKPIIDSIALTELEKNQSELILLDPNSPSTKVNIKWKTEFENSPIGNILEVSLLKKLPDNTYKYTQTDYKCNFNDTSVNNSTKGFAEAKYQPSGDKHCEIIGSVDATGNDYMVITPRYNYARDVSISIVSNSIPTQGFEIDSKGYAGKVMREIKSNLLTEGKSASILRVLNNTIYSNGYSSK